MNKRDFYEAGIIFNRQVHTNVLKNLFPGNFFEEIHGLARIHAKKRGEKISCRVAKPVLLTSLF